MIFHLWASINVLQCSLFSLWEDGLAEHQAEREHRDVQVKVALPGETRLPDDKVNQVRAFTSSKGQKRFAFSHLKASLVQIRHGDFRLRISQDEEDIQSVLDWYNRSSLPPLYNSEQISCESIYWFLFTFRVDAVFLDHLSQDIRGTNSSAVWRWKRKQKQYLSLPLGISLLTKTCWGP